MKRLRCAIRSFIETLRGLGAYEFDGHVYDEHRRYELRQYEFATCSECGTEVEQGWHRMGEHDCFWDPQPIKVREPQDVASLRMDGLTNEEAQAFMDAIAETEA